MVSPKYYPKPSSNFQNPLVERIDPTMMLSMLFGHSKKKKKDFVLFIYLLLIFYIQLWTRDQSPQDMTCSFKNKFINSENQFFIFLFFHVNKFSEFHLDIIELDPILLLCFFGYIINSVELLTLPETVLWRAEMLQGRSSQNSLVSYLWNSNCSKLLSYVLNSELLTYFMLADVISHLGRLQALAEPA